MLGNLLWAGHYRCPSSLLQPVEPHTIEEFFGIPEGHKSAPSECGYILFYQTRQEAPPLQPEEIDTT